MSHPDGAQRATGVRHIYLIIMKYHSELHYNHPFVLQVHKIGNIYLGGPPLVKAATGEVVSGEELGE